MSVVTSVAPAHRQAVSKANGEVASTRAGAHAITNFSTETDILSRMTYEATQKVAVDLIAVHGRGALWVAGECVRALRHADKQALSSWVDILEAVRSRLSHA